MYRYLLIVFMLCGMFCAAQGEDWISVAPGKGGTYEFKANGSNGFSAVIKANGSKERAGIIGCYTFDRQENVKDLAVNFKVANTGKVPVEISGSMSFREGSKGRVAYGRTKYSIQPGMTLAISMPFKEEFKVNSDTAHIYQLKIGAALKKPAAGAVASVTVKDVELGKARFVTHFPIAPGKGAEYDFKNISAEEFSLGIKRNAEKGKAAIIVCSNIDRAIHSQHKLQFSCRVAKGDQPVMVKPIISYLEGKRSVMCWGPGLVIKGSTWKDYNFSLDSTYKLSDAVYQFRQLKFGVSIDGAKPGTEVLLEVRNVRIVSPDDAGNNTGLNEVIVHPQKKNEVKAASDALKVFVHFDNEDLATVYDGRGRMRKLKDDQAYPGFRHLLFETVQKDVRLVKTPEEAQLIVYSAARPDKKLASRIVKAVKKGANLIASSIVADPEIQDILPVEVNVLPSNDFPERKKLTPRVDDPALLDGLSDAAFGVYTDLFLRSGKVLLTYADGKPAMVEGKAGKGKVIYNAVAIGCDLVPGYTARDPFLLRTVSYLSGRKLPLVKKADGTPDKDGYFTGAGKENFGRFGIILGDGLLTEEVNNYLSVINNSQEYRFTNSQTPKIKLGKWNFKTLSPDSAAKSVGWQFEYSHIGKVEYSTDCVVPANWKGAPIQFAVQNGIDDLGEVFFNGKSIGKVTVDMSEYWMRPHRYTIPAKLINFGGKNTITVVAENIRGNGSFGSCPELVQLNPDSSKPWKFVPDRINWLGKGGVVTEDNGSSRRFDTSLAFPGVRWEIFSDRTDMEISNVATHCAYKSKDGIKIVNLLGADSIPSDWSEPWLLLFKEDSDHPLMLVFSKRQDKIEVAKAGGAVSALTFNRKGGVGMIVPVWLYGREPVKTAAWKSAIPSGVQEKIAFWSKRAFKYPVSADESFKIDGKAKRVNIRTSFKYITTPNDWGVTSADYAPVSPLAWFSKGKLFDSSEVTDWGVVTSYGNYAAKDNSDTVNWSLPLPQMVYRTVPGSKGHDELVKAGNDIFKDGSKWSCGGGVRDFRWSLAYPSASDFPLCFNISMHGWLMGLNQALTAPYDLDDVSMSILRRRLRKRYFDGVEFAQFKAAMRWREEPMSGIRYSVYFGNRHLHATKYAPGTGTTINYADCNETAYMILSLGRMLADRHGQAEFVRANASYMRDAARLLLVSDDWGYMACHCRESGLSATIDMLNCEYAAMMSLARLAEIIKDDALRAQALYRAARRMVPTYTRLVFRDYAVKNRLVPYSESISFGVGFAETGYSFRTKGTLPKELDLFDTSQGIPEELIHFYENYAAKELVPYLDGHVLKTLYGKDGRFQLGQYLLGVAAQASALDPAAAEKLANAAVKEAMDKKNGKLKRLGRDWPGMCFLPYLSQVLYRIDGNVKLHTSRDAAISKFIWDPAESTVELEVTPGKNPLILLESKLKPADSTLATSCGLIKVPVKGSCRQTVKVKLVK